MKISLITILTTVCLFAAMLPTDRALAAGGRGTGTAKVLVVHAVPGYVIAAFEGAHTGPPDATDPGLALLESTTPAAIDSRITELFVPVGIVTAMWLWEQHAGYSFLGNLEPSDNPDPIEIDATAVVSRHAPVPEEPASSTAAVYEPPPPPSEHTTKVLVPDAQPGQVITAFEGTYVPETDGADPGIASLESTIPVPPDGKPAELFVPVGIASSIWVWDEQTGYQFLGNVIPGEKSQPIELSATGTQ